MTSSSAPDIIHRLVATFATYRDDYRAGKYNETQLRREFLDPFWKALGWDVDNESGYAEAYKDVIHEDAIKVSGEAATKAPDYCFRIGGTRKFFLEAKKPSVDIAKDAAPAFQLRRYAWSAKLPLSVLSDFEELAVYDTRVKPEKTDAASRARISLIPFDQYVDRWDEIASVFSRDAVLKGSFDRYAETNKGKRGTAQVDAAFLSDIESWRDELARMLAIRNPSLSQRELNFAVQRTIDRVVFLRICEDRGIETYGNLLGVTNGANVYARLLELFVRADQRFNSGLFHFSPEKTRSEAPDTLTPSLAMDDRPLKSIIRSLYYPDSPYEFSVLGADILGQVYEQFLGKVIRLTPAHRAVVEEKPEVKKAGGVYYTPTYIVDYIVRHTVGTLLEGKTPRDVAGGKTSLPLRVLDPACGSGSFLLGAYQHLLDWYRDQYVAEGVERYAKGKAPALYQGQGGDWRLTTSERKRILISHIYGVDIDEQAVEVTKLSLLLKVLEGESDQTLASQFALFHDRVLPDLDDNIKSGNSLIGSEFYDQLEMGLLDADTRRRVNAFDWKTEFAPVFDGKAGGFDAVIGNPPYVRIQTMTQWYPEEAAYYKRAYESGGKGNFDLYVLFVERGLSLLGPQGRLGYILPHKFFNAKYGEPLRGIIARGKHLSEVVHFGDQQVFAGATTYTALLTLTRATSQELSVSRVRDLVAWRSDASATRGIIPTSQLSSAEWNLAVGSQRTLVNAVDKTPARLGDAVERIFQGLVTGADRAFVVVGQEAANIEADVRHPYLRSDSIPAYGYPGIDAWMLFPYRIVGGAPQLIPAYDFETKYPNAWAHLRTHEKELRARENGRWDHDQWYAFGRSQNLSQMDLPKLIIQVLSVEPRVIFDDRGFYMTGGGSGPFYGLRAKRDGADIRLLLAIMNSRLFGQLVATQSTQMRGGYIKFSKQYIENVRVPAVALSRDANPKLHDEIVALAQRMLDLNRELAAARLAAERTQLQRQLEATDRQIDRLVYDLYELTDDEIAIVESAAA